jgi:hypothetical protein
MVPNGSFKNFGDKHCLNIVAVLVLKIKSIRAGCFLKANVYSFQEIADITSPFYGCINGNRDEAGSSQRTF